MKGRLFSPSTLWQNGRVAVMLAAATFVLAAFSGCGDPPEACFDVSETLVDQNEDVLFTNCSQFQQNGYLWDFGDGTTSANTSPTHRFTTQGEFLVSLTSLGKTSATDDVTTQIVKVGKRMLQSIQFTAIPATDILGNPWDPSDDPDISLLFIKAGVVQFQTPTNTNLGTALPYTENISATPLDLTPDTWLFALVDVDSASVDTMAKVTMNLNGLVPNAQQTIVDDHVSTDWLMTYTLQ